MIEREIEREREREIGRNRDRERETVIGRHSESGRNLEMRVQFAMPNLGLSVR